MQVWDVVVTEHYLNGSLVLVRKLFRDFKSASAFGHLEVSRIRKLRPAEDAARNIRLTVSEREVE